MSTFPQTTSSMEFLLDFFFEHHQLSDPELNLCCLISAKGCTGNLICERLASSLPNPIGYA